MEHRKKSGRVGRNLLKRCGNSRQKHIATLRSGFWNAFTPSSMRFLSGIFEKMHLFWSYETVRGPVCIKYHDCVTGTKLHFDRNWGGTVIVRPGNKDYNVNVACALVIMWETGSKCERQVISRSTGCDGGYLTPVPGLNLLAKKISRFSEPWNSNPEDFFQIRSVEWIHKSPKYLNGSFRKENVQSETT